MTNPNQVRISNTFSISIVEKGSILQMTSVNFIPYGLAYDGRNGLWVTSFGSNQLVKLDASTFARVKSVSLPGDSLFTDIAYDRDKDLMYIHRMNSTSGNGGYVLVVDTNGKLVRQFQSPANVYPIGIEILDGKLLIGDRDKKDQYGKQMLMIVNPENGVVEATYQNPYSKTYGPRGIAYDREAYVYQVGTYFPNSGALTEAVAIRIHKSNLSAEVDRISLQSPTGIINARGIEYDPRDKNLWITDYQGNIYKIAGFDLILSSGETNISSRKNITEQIEIKPNPARDFVFVSFIPNPKVSPYKLQIINQIGTVLYEQQIETVQLSEVQTIRLDIANFSSGIYFAILKAGEKGILVGKFNVIK
jgi:DNA-binding beta-propeller fold protein YncE